MAIRLAVLLIFFSSIYYTLRTVRRPPAPADGLPAGPLRDPIITMDTGPFDDEKLVEKPPESKALSPGNEKKRDPQPESDR